MDRGFDDVFWLRWMHAKSRESVIRVKSNRSVHPGTTQEKAIIGQLAETRRMSHDSDPLREQVEPCREISKHPVRPGAYPGQVWTTRCT
jgi:hypothetical protein